MQSVLSDDEVLEFTRPLYDDGIAIWKIAQSLHMSKKRLSQILRSVGYDTSHPVRKEIIHPYGIAEPMKRYGWTINFVCDRMNANRDNVVRWQRVGLPWQAADKFALKMKMMPQDLWDNWWDFE